MSATDGCEWPASHLTVTVLQARRLRSKDRHGGINPYVQVHLGKQSFITQTVPNTFCPVWNDAVTFALPTPRDDATAVTLTVMHRRSLAALPDRFLGRAEVRLLDACRNHLPVCTKWFTLESKPKKKVKDRGEMEVSFCLANLLSPSSRVDSQLSSICGANPGGWGSTEPHGPSSVQPAEKRAPIQPSCAVAPVLDQAPPSVAELTHERAASPACVSSSSGADGEYPERAAWALANHCGLDNMTAADKRETTAVQGADCKAGDGTPVASKDDGNPPAAKGISSTTAQASPPPHPTETSSATTGQTSKLLMRLGYVIRQLQYRWGLRANRGEIQPLTTPDGHPENSACTGEGVSEALGGAPGTGSGRLRALCLWVERCLGRR